MDFFGLLFNNSEKTDSDDSYTTISEHETTDTSINRTESLDQSEDSEESEHSETSEHSESSDSSSDDLETSDSEINDVFMGDSTMESGYSFFQNAVTSALETDSEMDWDVTTSSVGVPEDPGHSSFASLLGRISTIISPRKKMSEEQQMAILRQEAFRERSWTLEECSICFDVMLRNQEVTSLPCTHNFHTDCIMPWLQEKQTCPNCRKVA